MRTWKLKKQEKTVSPPFRIYRTCSELPLSIFIECVCDEKYDLLIIEGHPSRTDISEAWLSIISEYFELRENGVGETWQSLKEIIRLQNHLYIVEKCIQFLHVRYSVEVAKALRSLGYVFVENPYDREKYVLILDQIAQKSKNKYIRLQQLLVEYEQKVKDSTGSKMKRESFDEVLIEIEQMQGTSYDIRQLTVSKFILLEKKFLKQVERQKVKHVH
jgi:hypothetical protein